jgi:hypothetical protein
MTRKEAEKLAEIFATADSGCPDCVTAICREATVARLGWDWWREDSGSWDWIVRVGEAGTAPKEPQDDNA